VETDKMIWLLCWAEIIDRYSQTLAPKAKGRALPPEQCNPVPNSGPRLRLVAVDGALVA
jgi:hypothetical protein